jgi:hypothetical protein
LFTPELSSQLHFLFSMKCIVSLSLVLLFFSSCSKEITPSLVSHSGNYPVASGTDTMCIHFLGTACFYFEYKNAALLTDPFISNPPFRKVTFGKVQPNPAIIYDYITTEQLSKVKMVTVGHAHYDHLLDLPEMAKHIPAQAKISGSATAHHLTAAAQLPQEKIIATNFTATHDAVGKWIYSTDSSVRIMPVISGHPPHAMGITLYGGTYINDLSTIPMKARKWKMGEPLAYLADFFNETNDIAFRIWIQTSGAEFPKAFFPKNILDEKSIDVGLYSTATGLRFEDFPEKIVAHTSPHVIFMAHWENFLRNKYKPVKTVAKGNQEKIFRFLQERFGNSSTVVLPHPNGKFQIF